MFFDQFSQELTISARETGQALVWSQQKHARIDVTRVKNSKNFIFDSLLL